MARMSPRSHRSQRTAVVVTVLVVLVIALTSYAIAAEFTPPTSVGVPTTPATDERLVDWAATDREQPTPSTATTTATVSSSLGVEDGVIPDGETLSPFDSEHPAIMNLDPELRSAIRRAATDANADGVEMVINSGWRSRRYQQALLDEAVVTYGSEEEARK